MPDPVISPFVGLALSIPGLLNLANDLLQRWKDFFRAMKGAERDGELLSIRFEHLTQRYVSLQNVLFKDGKFEFISGRVFDHLPDDQRNILANMFRELARLLYTAFKLGQDRNLSLMIPTLSSTSLDISMSPDDLAILFAETGFTPRHGSPRLKFSWRDFAWAASNKKHVETFLDQYESWIKRIRETMEDFWWPLSFFDKFSNMQVLESDEEFISSGMVIHSRLRKLLLDDSPLTATLELRPPHEPITMEERTSIPLRMVASLGNQRVLIETMPYKVDSRGFMPAELRRRFCTIAALLNAQDIEELHVLRCLNWREIRAYDGSKSSSSFQLLSQLPATGTTDFVTLTELIRIRRGSLKPSLDARFAMGHILAQTLSECFSIGWRHRSVRANNILFFVQDARVTGDQDLMHPFLCGFDESRLQDDFSMNSHGDNSINSNIYRHPDRWGTPKAGFDIYHDLYAFGVVLLEIGLWEPIAGALERNSNKKLISTLDAKEAKEALLAACRNEIGHKCGSSYSQMIEMCLMSDFGVDKASDTKLQTNAQVMFREEILDRLRESRAALAVAF